MSSFTVFLVGFLILIGGLVYGAFLAGVPPQWIGAGAVVMLGIGIVVGAIRVLRRDERGR